MNRSTMERLFATQFANLSRRWRLLGDQVLSRLNVSSSSGWCLVYMQRLGEGACQSDLARALGVREPTLVRTLNGLEQAKLIERFPHPQDARAKLTRLTVNGASIVRDVEDCLKELRHELLASVSNEDLAATLRVYESIEAALTERRD
ncbi:MarR family transcriptional regulator [Novosphingobium mangrovi (ex Huang et al. 2023)]|uniref:MarR family transcriptional regulator n=1 Tax=Novosphingobium mangrovi (ex Huang et al. 2023) TaxID=2976432 RepID=A0ABT2I1L6_9SPHN|nr:MarR family transcriptional regulator [Novosphingobium mangrovi (ex Huang et al. 2023)]MCT2398694.1 MarR family transcriptional regulator [Novosphingobium mangrovi (ex Huang et al. 2023)]